MKPIDAPLLWDDSTSEDTFVEDPRYFKEQLITYIGNKRSLLHTIDTALKRVIKKLGKSKIDILDAFAGSGVVSRFLKQYASRLVSNDLELYSKIIGDCYLTNRSDVDVDELKEIHADLVRKAEKLPVRDGFIRRLYSPEDDNAIKEGERVFYTTENAMLIDSYRYLIEKVPKKYQHFMLAPLLSEASVHNNTSGVFKGFYKNDQGIGQFGGNNRDALSRILGKIVLPFPIFSLHECDIEVTNCDANKLVRDLKEVDVAYFDPPYNQHPYGSNYFMLNLIVENKEPVEYSRVSGIATNWQRSNYNKPKPALSALVDLVENTPAKFLLISYNSEGFVTREQFDDLLHKHGRVEVIETKYNTFRGSRNLRERSIHVKEQLFLLERR